METRAIFALEPLNSSAEAAEIPVEGKMLVAGEGPAKGTSERKNPRFSVRRAAHLRAHLLARSINIIVVERGFYHMHVLLPQAIR